MHSKRIKIGIVGVGLISQIAHIANYAEIEDCEIVALAAGRSELRGKVAERYGIAHTYDTHKELLADSRIDAVVVIIAREGTGPVALDCLNAGKSLLTEKPMAATLEQAQRLVKAAQSSKKFYNVGYFKRYDAGVQHAKILFDDLIQSNELGPIIYTKVHCFGSDVYYPHERPIETDEKKTKGRETWPIAPDWVPEDHKQEYQHYLNSYCHSINLIRYLYGRSPSVSHVDFSKQGVKVATLDFGDHIALIESGKYSYRGWDEYIEIYFADGRLKIKTPAPLLKNVPAQVDLYKGGNMHQECRYHEQWSWAFRKQAEDFVRDIREGNESLTSGADSLEDMRIIEDMWKINIEK